MSIGQALQNEIEDSKRWLYFEKDDSTYKEIYKKLKSIIWLLENLEILIYKL
jgi:hypothetical protein